MKKILGIVAIAAIGGLVAVGIQSTFDEEAKEIVRVVEQLPVRTVSYGGEAVGVTDFTVAAEKTVNSVVHIQNRQTVHSRSNPWMEMLGQVPIHEYESSGSGVIISHDGYIVTNNHVIEGADKLRVTLNDNRTIEAEVIGADPAYDLALIKIDESDLPFVTFGSSDNVRIGEWVLAVGNPFNLTSTVTAGIVSAKARNINLLGSNSNREVFPVESFIQTDAAVNPGNSGGALVNTRGELIGINTAIASRTGSYSGYSFAVPSSIVQKVTHDLLEYGNVQRAYIGVSISDLDQDLADRLGIDEVNGVYVNGLTPDGAAASVGMEVGDIIYSVEDRQIANVAQLQEQISKYRPGDKIKVSLKRDNKMLAYDVVVRDRQGNTSLNALPAKLESTSAFGAIFKEISADEAARLNISGGAKLSKDSRGYFRGAGMKEGFIITQIDKRKVSTPSDVSSLLSSMEGGVLIAGVYPNGTVAYYGFGM